VDVSVITRLCAVSTTSICRDVFLLFSAAKQDGQKQDEKKPKKAAKSLKVLDPKAGQNLCK